VQKGPFGGLEIKAFPDKGLGLVTRININKGTFICEYAGEIISPEEADKRSQNDEMNYILHIVEHFGSGDKKTSVTVIDPTVIGNILP
jgi:histone-lysine N-methyltransferase SETMAR